MVHVAVLLVFIALIMNILSLGPALLEVATQAHGSPGIVWMIFLVPYPPFIVSVDRFLYQEYGINLFLGGYAIVAYFIILEIAILLSCYYLFRKDGADLLCQLYNGILNKDVKHVSGIPLIGVMLQPFVHGKRRTGPEGREAWQETRASQEGGRGPRAERAGYGPPYRPSSHHPHDGRGVAEGPDAPVSLADYPWLAPPTPSPVFSNVANKFGSEDNAIILTIKFFMVNLFVFTVYNILMYVIFGEGVETPDFIEEMRLWELLFGLARASVYEEFEARVLLLGLPLYFFHRRFNKQAFKNSNGMKNYLLGGNLEIDNWTVLFLLFSSIIFGLAHLRGWNVYKVIPTTIGGVLIGYLFIKKGLAAAILFHFLLDYFSIPYDLYPAPGILAFLGIVVLVSVLTGMVLTLYYCVRLWEWLGEFYGGKEGKGNRTEEIP